MDQTIEGIGPSLEDRLKVLAERLRQKGGVGGLEGEFRDLLEDTDPFQLERAETELMEQGFPRQDIQLICDARSELFSEVSEDEETYLEMPGHPIHTLMEEHHHILKFMEGVRETARRLSSAGQEDIGDRMELAEVEPFLREAQKHFQREENVLFPYLEKHGITGPPAAMWSEHEVLRAKERELLSLIGRQRYMDLGEFFSSLECQSAVLLSLLNAHFYRENHILFPMAIRMLDIHEWNEVRKQFDEIGCCNFVPHHATLAFSPVQVQPSTEAKGGEIVLPTGRFTQDELEMLLDHLPVDITFVDDRDRVRYFSHSPQRIFVRTPAVIGRAVQNCHPQQSVQAVQQIIDDLKSGTREVAEFWIQLEGRFIYIRYLPLRDKEGRYKGIMEVTQDVTRVRGLEGQKRLLDG